MKLTPFLARVQLDLTGEAKMGVEECSVYTDPKVRATDKIGFPKSRRYAIRVIRARTTGTGVQCN